MKSIITIVGPTASGKTDVSVEIARTYKQLNPIIISADSQQIYAGCDIGTGKVSKEIQYEIEHVGLDIVSPEKQYSVFDWVRYVIPHIEKALSENRLIIMVGGTGMYVSALQHGYEFHYETEADIELEAVSEMLEYCKAHGVSIPETDLANPRRIQRAYERHVISVSESYAVPKLPMHIVHISSDKDMLRERIERRVRDMYGNGLVDETRRIIDMYGHDAPALNAIGYAEAKWVCAGASNIETAVEKTIIKTKQYAKRQETWFRNKVDIDMECDSAEKAVSCLTKIIESQARL